MVVFSSCLAVGAHLFQLIFAVALPGNAEVDPCIGGLVGLYLEILFSFYNDHMAGRIGIGEFSAVVLSTVVILRIEITGKNEYCNKDTYLFHVK